MFRRVTRYAMRPGLDQRENRLTEATAIALEHVDGLAPAFVDVLLEVGERDARRRRLCALELQRRRELVAHARRLVPGRAVVETQVPTAKGRYVDLQVHLRPRPHDRTGGLLVWVEVKHGAGVHGDQLESYLTDIQGHHDDNGPAPVLVVLGPRGWAPPELPGNVLHADWQEFARVLPTLATTLDHPEQRWLLDEYIRYLKEEGLSDPNALTVSSALALMQHQEAAEAAAGVCEHASAYVNEHWGAQTDYARNRSGVPVYGLNYWSNHPTARDAAPEPRWQGVWFEWGLRYAPEMQYIDGMRGSYVFLAGATADPNNEPARRAGNEDWLGRRQAEGFHRLWLDNYKLVRMRYPDELLATTTLDAQGRALGEWIVGSFEALANDPPPA